MRNSVPCRLFGYQRYANLTLGCVALNTQEIKSFG
jgi:hypothetical protein